MRTVLCSLQALLLSHICFGQQVLIVDDDAPGDPGPGTVSSSDPLEDGTAEHPFDAIQEAIDAATPGATILVKDGTYSGLGNGDLNFGGIDLTVRSENGPGVTVLQADPARRLFVFRNGETSASRVEGLTLTGGRGGQLDGTVDCGGAVYCDGASPQFVDCIIRDNTTPEPSFVLCHGGAGVYLVNSSSSFSGCHFIGNQLGGSHTNFLNPNGHGGALFAEQSDINLQDCHFDGNATGRFGTAGFGGAVGLQTSTATIAGCLFSENRGGPGGWSWPGSTPLANGTGASGGAIGAASSELTLTDCIFVGNSAGEGADGGEYLAGRSGGHGGAVYLDNTATIMQNCLLFENRAGRGARAGWFSELEGGPGGWGGAVYAWNANVTILNSVLAGNLVDVGGPGAGGGDDGLPGFGGALGLGSESIVQLINCTTIDNASVSSGPAADVFQLETGTTLLVRNTIVRGAFDQLSGGDGSLSIHYSNVEGGFAGPGNIDADPVFVDPDGPDDLASSFGDNDYRPRLGAPGNDAGSNAAVPVTILADADGGDRFRDDPNAADTGEGSTPLVDMGAFEANNGLPAGCDEPLNESNDCNGNGIPDGCDARSLDCNQNGVPDDCDLASGTSDDCNANGIPDVCDTALLDCNGNGLPDDCDVTLGISPDCNGNGIPDECDLDDCNENGVPDSCDLALGNSQDCNLNGVPDSCDVAREDCDGNGVPDECDPDCDGDGRNDRCEVSAARGGKALAFPAEGEFRGPLWFGEPYRIPDGPVTIEAWVYPDGASSDQARTLVRKLPANYVLQLVSNRVHFWYRDVDGVIETYQTDAAIPADTWSHVAVTHVYGTDSTTVYLNGTPLAGSWSNPPTGLPQIGLSGLFVGTRPSSETLVGMLDEVRIWRSVRTADELRSNATATIAPTAPSLFALIPLEQSEGRDVPELVNGLVGDQLGLEWVDLNNCSGCSGDALVDGVVDLEDLGLVLIEFGQTGDNLAGDVDQNGRVDLGDLASVLGAFGNYCTP